ncbi:MAG TPA: decarboxylating 6-phosphogluconate dehydrogenase [Gemmatales bacterium]|nr:decarboxylating 6-phosphogluconate dehydrogenase [Gemmatales bacterium]
MQVGLVGLGRMGGNMVRRLRRDGHDCVVHDREPGAAAALTDCGAVPAGNLAELVAKLTAPRAVWVMLPAGSATEEAVQSLGELLAAGDIIIDGGNTHFPDDRRRAAALAERGIHYVDVGTSGGVWGLERGYCLMVGGPAEAVRRLEPLLSTLAPDPATVRPTPGLEGSSAARGYLHCGPAGAGHFVKMIHNGIEYGLMQAYAEGFELLQGATHHGFGFSVQEIAELWRRGSVVSSWLLDLAAVALAQDPALAHFQGRVPDSGEGRWTVQAAVEQGTPAEVLTAALYKRFRSRQTASFAEKLLSALRAQFGGHVEPPAP